MSFVIRFIGGGQESIGEAFREDEKKSEQQIVMMGSKSEHLMQGSAGGKKGMTPEMSGKNFGKE